MSGRAYVKVAPCLLLAAVLSLFASYGCGSPSNAERVRDRIDHASALITKANKEEDRIQRVTDQYLQGSVDITTYCIARLKQQLSPAEAPTQAQIDAKTTAVSRLVDRLRAGNGNEDIVAPITPRQSATEDESTLRRCGDPAADQLRSALAQSKVVPPNRAVIGDQYGWSAAIASLSSYYVRCAKAAIGEKLTPAAYASIDSEVVVERWTTNVLKALKAGEGNYKPNVLGGQSASEFVKSISADYAKDCPSTATTRRLKGL